MKDGLAYTGKWSDLSEILLKRVSALKQAIEFQFMMVVGPKTTAHAKSYSQFKDQTGNLRSSMGFILAKDGQIINSGGFESVSGPKGSGSEGIKEGREYAEKLARSSNGYVLIVVAGMNYATAVESKGFNVLTRSGTFLEEEANAMIGRILKKSGFK